GWYGSAQWPAAPSIRGRIASAAILGHRPGDVASPAAAVQHSVGPCRMIAGALAGDGNIRVLFRAQAHGSLGLQRRLDAVLIVTMWTGTLLLVPQNDTFRLSHCPRHGVYGFAPAFAGRLVIFLVRHLLVIRRTHEYLPKLGL